MIRAIAIVAVLGGVATAAPDEITVEQAIRLYREHSPRLVAEGAKLDVAAADRIDARIYPNPTVGVAVGGTLHGDTAGPLGQYELDLGIPLLIGRQRARRESAADAHVDAARAALDATGAAAELAIRSRFATLLAAQRRTATLAEAVADARALREIVAGRQAAGATSPYAVERIDLAIATLDNRLADARSSELQSSGELASAVGVFSWHPRAAGDLDALGVQPPTGIDPSHPVLLVDRFAQAAARADQHRAEADGLPVPSLALSGLATRDPVGQAFTIGISLPLPLFDRNQGAVARARAEQHKAELERAADAAELAGDLERATRLLAARRAGLAKFRAEALERLPRLRAMAESSYKSGQGGIIELLDALDAITEAKLREIDLLGSVIEAELAVRAAGLGR